jgi:hypothetical protein
MVSITVQLNSTYDVSFLSDSAYAEASLAAD